MLYIPSSRNEKIDFNIEERYVNIFKQVSLAKNFYFSYSYNLSQTLQFNQTIGNVVYNDLFVWNFNILEPALDQVFQFLYLFEELFAEKQLTDRKR